MSPQFSRDAYSKMMIAPVNTAYLMDKTGWSVLTLKDKQTLQQDVKELALYAQELPRRVRPRSLKAVPDYA